MSIELLLLNIYLLLAVMFTIYFATYSLIRKESRLARLLAYFCCLVALYLVGYLFELNSSTLDQMAFWGVFQYIGISFYPAFWLLISNEFIYRGKRKLKIKPMLLFLIPTFTFLARLTNEFHHLFYTTTDIAYNGSFYVMILEKGPLYFLQAIYFLFLVTMSTIQYVQLARKSKADIRNLTYRLVLLSVLPLIGLGLILSPLKTTGIDFTALILPLSIFLFASIIHNRNFFPLKIEAMKAYFNIDQQGILIFNHHHLLVDANPYALQLDPTLKFFLQDPLMPKEKQLTLYQSLYQDGTPRDMEFNGRTYYVRPSDLKDDRKQIIGTVIIFVDITNRVAITNALTESKRELAHLLYHDALTNLYNRRYLKEYLENSSSNDYPFLMLYLDLNDLKKINDQYGHLYGDDILVQAGAILTSCVAEEDRVIRISGDEFVVLKPQGTWEEGRLLVDAIKQKCAEKKDIAFSIGCSFLNNQLDYLRAYQDAERLMYAEKQTKPHRS